MSRDRGTDPSRVNPCKGCGKDVIASDVGIAEHRAYHMDWEALYGGGYGPPSFDRMEAWRAYAHALERDVDARVKAAVDHVEDQRERLLRDIADRDEVIESLTADYEHLLAELRDLRQQMETTS